jgi:hypothetical protein
MWFYVPLTECDVCGDGGRRVSYQNTTDFEGRKAIILSSIGGITFVVMLGFYLTVCVGVCLCVGVSVCVCYAWDAVV